MTAVRGLAGGTKPPNVREGTGNSHPRGGRLKSVEKMPVAVLGQVSSASSLKVLLLFSVLRGSPDTETERLKCGYQAVFAESLDAKFLVLKLCSKFLALCWVLGAHYLVFPSHRPHGVWCSHFN